MSGSQIPGGDATLEIVSGQSQTGGMWGAGGREATVRINRS